MNFHVSVIGHRRGSGASPLLQQAAAGSRTCVHAEIASALLLFKVLVKCLLESPLCEPLTAPQGFHNGRGKWIAVFFMFWL